MASRVISAIVGIPILVAAVWVGMPWLSLLAAVLAALGALEFYRMVERRETRPAVLLGIAWALGFIVSGHRADWPAPLVAVVGAAATFSWHQLRRLSGLPGLTKVFAREIGTGPRGFSDSLSDWVYTAAGAFYIGWTLSLFLILRGEMNGREWVLVAILGAFATDTGAFITGKAFGRRPLAPRISPGKTWEGAAGGFLLGTGAVMALSSLLELPVSMWEGAVLGALIGVSAQMGDLLESMIKRASRVKDAGNIIPGHGGVLDRLDSVVFVIVVVYHFFVWIIK
ncbi:MAG: phosphatidate cytidylyltransferase [Chloroflexi bacterium]|nr:phosphatidate cytidylyltransferase [Chloroflexota bacterium]